MNQQLFKKHQALLNEALGAIKTRQYFSPYPEHPKAYASDLNQLGKDAFGRLLNENFTNLAQEAEDWIGEEVSPFWQMGLGILYPALSTDRLIQNAENSWEAWKATRIEDRTGLLIESLERVRLHFFELCYANMHTSGQAFLMSFQAAGPHAADRALEAIAYGYRALTEMPKNVNFVKPLGKFNLEVEKEWVPISKGIALVIGCSTFPTWNSVPGIYASLITGNPVIAKPHPKSILPLATWIAELRKLLKENDLPADIIQLAVDTQSNPITKELAEHSAIKLVDYTGGNEFGNYVETLNKIVFTEKSGINTVLIDSAKDLNAVAQNIAFSVALYSGQMCTAPQNIYISEKIQTEDGEASFEQVSKAIVEAVKGVINHPKMGAGTLGSVQNDGTLRRIKQLTTAGNVMLAGESITNPEFVNARTQSPTIIATDTSDDAIQSECFGPLVYLVKTKDSTESIKLASESGEKHGAITCLAFTTDAETMTAIKKVMNNVFVPVSFNLQGAGMVNQHAAFSDLHGTGGNPAGNSTFTDPSFINRRFVWIGNRWME